jgi:hypothetical protein
MFRNTCSCLFASNSDAKVRLCCPLLNPRSRGARVVACSARLRFASFHSLRLGSPSEWQPRREDSGPGVRLFGKNWEDIWLGRDGLAVSMLMPETCPARVHAQGQNGQKSAILAQKVAEGIEKCGRKVDTEHLRGSDRLGMFITADKSASPYKLRPGNE